MVNLGETRVNRKIGTSGGIDGSRPPRTTPAPRRPRAPAEAVAAGTIGACARIVSAGVPSLTKRYATHPPCLFSARAVACRPGSGILAEMAGSPGDPSVWGVARGDLECGED